MDDFDTVSSLMRQGLTALEVAKASQTFERRDTLGLVRKLCRGRASALRTAGNPGGARAVEDLARDLAAQLKAMHSL